MTAALLERPVSERLDLDGGGTLEELLTSALTEARANGSTQCPVCRGRMSSKCATATAAECESCGSRLS